jgi:hypothetical protein
VITEFTDINWECNGVLDMWRNIKECGSILPAVQQQDVVVARTDRFAYWPEEQPEVRVNCSRYSAASTTPLSLRWSTSQGDSGSVTVMGAAEGSVTSVPSFALPAARKGTQGRVRLNLRLVGAAGTTIATNFVEYTVYARPADSGGGDVVVVHSIDTAALALLREGKNVLCLMDSVTTFPEGFPLIPVRRDSGWYDGNWASALNWARTSAVPFKGISFDNRFGFESAGMTMPFALRGIPAEHFEDVLAGMFIGWVHRHAGYVVQMRVGQGKLIVCALPLQRTEKTDSYAASLLQHLKSYLVSGDCRPRWGWAVQ